jgi:hypothetical protein
VVAEELPRMLTDFIDPNSLVVLGKTTPDQDALLMKIFASRLWPYPYHTSIPWRFVADPFIKEQIEDARDVLKAVVNDLLNRDAIMDFQVPIGPILNVP